MAARVRVAAHGDEMVIRSSKHLDGPVIVGTRDGWATFLEGVRQGDFDDLRQLGECRVRPRRVRARGRVAPPHQFKALARRTSTSCLISFRCRIQR
jgi:hypothetical protein